MLGRCSILLYKLLILKEINNISDHEITNNYENNNNDDDRNNNNNDNSNNNNDDNINHDSEMTIYDQKYIPWHT